MHPIGTEKKKRIEAIVGGFAQRTGVQTGARVGLR